MSKEIESMLQYQPIQVLQKLENQISLYSDQRNYVIFDKATDKLNGAWSLDLLLLRWVQQSVVSDNPRSVKQLKHYLEEYNKENKDANLNLDEIVSKGLIRIVWDTYYLPQRFIFRRKEVSQESEHIFRFMFRLSDVPYPDSCVIRLQNAEQTLLDHKSCYDETPEITWFLENNVLEKEEKSYLLNYSSDYVRNCSEFILSRLWMEKTIGPSDSDDRLDWWIPYILFFSYRNKFIHNIYPLLLGELLDACCTRLLKEEDIIGWEAERRKLVGEQLSTSDFSKMNQYMSEISLPKDDSDIEKLFWFDQPSEAAIYIHRPREILGMLFHWIIEGEGQGTVWEDRPRLHMLLSKRRESPFIFYELRNLNPSIIPTLLVHPDLLKIGLILLAKWKPSNQGIYNNNEARKIEERIFSESFSYISYYMKLLYDKPEKIASIFEETLTWFEKEARTISFRAGTDLLPSILRKRELLLDWLQQKLTNSSISSLDKIMPQYWSRLLMKKLEEDQNPIDSLLFPQLLWLIKLHYNGGPSLQVEDVMQNLIKFYKKTHQFCRDGWIWSERISTVMSDQVWNMVFKWAINHAEKGSDDSFLLTLLHPINIQEFIKEQPAEKDKQYGWNRMASDRIAVHLNFLAHNIVGLKGLQNSEGFQMLVATFRVLLLDSLKKHGEVMFHPFDESLGYIPTWTRKEINILNQVVEAINILQDEVREKLILNIISESQDPGLLSTIFNKLEREKDKNLLLKVLDDQTKVTDCDVWLLSGLKSIVTELLNAQNVKLAELAQKHLDNIRSKFSSKVLNENAEWLFREQLRIYLIKKNYDQIYNYNSKEALGKNSNILSFYQALAYLENVPSQLETAIMKLELLHKEDKANLAYQVNLYAAYVRAATEAFSNGNSSLSDFLKKAEGMLKKIKGMPKKITKSVDLYVNTNRLYLSVALKDFIKFWEIYRDLDARQKYSLPIGIYSVQILIDELNWEGAERKLQEVYQWNGVFPEYERLFQDIQERKKVDSNPIHPNILLMELLQWPSIATAINNLGKLSSEEQVKALKGNESYTVKDYILETVLDMCREVLKYSPSITPSEKLQAEEDRYTDLLVLLLNQRLLPIGWSAVSQSRGGYTGVSPSHRGGIGERDLIIMSRERTELAIGEALNLNGFKTAEIEGHTKKIFGYDTTRCHFHIVINWGFSNTPDKLWSQYKKLLVSRMDGLFPVVSFGESNEMFPKHNFQGVRSFYTRHDTDTEGGTALAIHLYVDVLNEKLKEIAEEARRHKK